MPSPDTFLEKRLCLVRWTSWFALCNGLLLTAFSFNFIRYMPEFQSPLQHGYVVAALLGQFGALGYLVMFAALMPLLLAFGSARLVKPLAVLLGTLGCAALVVDYLVYARYRFHLNGVLLNLVIEDGGREIFVFSWWTWFLAALGLAGIVAVQVVMARQLTRRLLPGVSWHGGWLALVLAAALLGSHGMHIWAAARYDDRITGLTRHIPAYYPTTANRFLHGHGWADLDENRERAMAMAKQQGGKGGLDYPKAPLRCEKAPPPNLLMIVVDAWRHDELEARVSPFLDRFSRSPGTYKFTRHHSGGNSTKSGIFSLMYGLPSSYWEAFAGSITPPVLIDQLRRSGYQFGVFGSAALTHPAFDRTVFATVPDLRTSSEGSSPWRRDLEITREWGAFLERRDPDRPFFGFLFYDAPHGYDYPPDAIKPYTPVWDRVDHLALDDDFDPLPYFNRHRVAVRYVDDLVGQAVAELETRGLDDNTVVLITSDHGEEFNDNGLNYWGHGSNYTRHQVQVPMLVRIPGRDGGEISHRTSHMDVAPTLMSEVLGCANPPGDFSIGTNMFEVSDRSWLYAGSYYNYAVLLEDAILVTFPTGHYEFLDLDNRPLPGRRLPAKTSMEVLQAMSRFYR